MPPEETAVATPPPLTGAERSMLASLKVRDYTWLWIGMLTSAFGMNMQIVAQGWLVYELSSSPMQLTWVSLAQVVPQVIFSLPGGVLADRIAKRPLIMWAPALNGIASTILGIIILTGDATFWDFVWVAFFNGSVLSLSIPARTAFIPEIVGERLMFNAMAFNTAAWNLSRILGPAFAGFLIAVIASGDTSSHFGVGIVYMIISVLYFVAAWTVRYIGHRGDPTADRGRSPWADTWEGLNYVIHSPVVGGLILLSIIPFLFGLSLNTLLPAFSTDVLKGGAEDLGLLTTGLGAGAIAGSLLLAKLGNLRDKGMWIIATGALWGLFVALFGLCAEYVFAFACIASVGFISAINMSMNRSVTQLQVDHRMRGRIMSIDMMSHGLMPIGMIPIGWIAEHFSIQAGLVTSGLLLMVVTLGLAWFMPAVRNIGTGYENTG